MSSGARLGEYTVWLVDACGQIQAVADFLLESDHRGRHRHSGLRYHDHWLKNPDAFPLNPVHAPLQTEPLEWRTPETPAVLDEILPGQWERTVLRHRWNQDSEPRDPDDLHAVLGAPRSVFRPGAVEILPVDTRPPPLKAPLHESELGHLIRDARELEIVPQAALALLQRLQGGSSAGGARPKLLLSADDGQYLAKLNRDNDPFDHVRVEFACLSLARAAGLTVPDCRIAEVGDRRALMIRRFDISDHGGRRHMISANALLKDADQRDVAHARYDDLATLIRHHGAQPAADLARLYRQMLFNNAINNRDDHLKNFSFLQGPNGLHLSPTYDLVPSEALGAWPVLGFGHQATLPHAGTDAALKAAATFGLPPAEAREINHQLTEALADSERHFQTAALNPTDQGLLARLFTRPESP